MDLVKCDKCGKTEEVDNNKDRNQMLPDCWYFFETMGAGGGLDLCPDCYNSVLAFIHGSILDMKTPG